MTSLEEKILALLPGLSWEFYNQQELKAIWELRTIWISDTGKVSVYQSGHSLLEFSHERAKYVYENLAEQAKAKELQKLEAELDAAISKTVAS